MDNGISTLKRKSRFFFKANEQAGKSLDWQTIVTIFTIWLPITAMIYWWVFFMNFKSDYFDSAYNIDDILFILLKKAVKFGFAIIINLFIAWLFLFRTTHRAIRQLVMVFVMASIMFGVCKSESFSFPHIAVLLGMTLGVTIMFILFDKGAIYGYSLVFGLFLFFSAKTDAVHAHENMYKYDIISSSGKVILDSSDQDRFYVGNTSKYVLIFNRTAGNLEKYDKHTIR